MNHKREDSKTIDFPLMLGGPLYQFYLRTFLVKPPLHLLKRRITAITLFSWLPLLVLTFLGGTAFGRVKIPFLFDIDTHLKLLVSLGLLIASEVVAHKFMQVIVNQFIERRMITPDVEVKFDNIVASALKLRNSTIAELLLLMFVYTVGHFTWMKFSSLAVPSWYGTIINGKANLTMAGYWYVYISIPIFQFILCRWYFRLFIWYRFLWQVSSLPLHLNNLHPDKAGGLDFLSMSVSAFKAGLLAHSVLLAGLIVNRIWHMGQSLLEFKLEIVGFTLFLLFLVLTPLSFFCIPLIRAKQKGLINYGIVASDYVDDFCAKWIKNKSNNNEELLGNPDIQSLADLSNSFNVAKEMRLAPFSRNTVTAVVFLSLLPILPLLLTTFPTMEMIKKIIQILF